MKNKFRRNALLVFTVLMGVAGYMMRSGLYASGLDRKNLLVRGHPLEAALWAFSGAMVLLILLELLHRPRETAPVPGTVLIPALGHLLAGGGIFLTVLWYSRDVSSPLASVWKAAGLLCGPAFLWGAVSLLRRRRPFFGIYGLGCVFFALHLICHYQVWCSDPQLQNYVFSFLGILLLMLYAYYRCAFCVSGGVSPLMRGAGLLAGYCCLVALVNDPYPLLLVGCCAWVLTGAEAPGTGK